MNIKKRLKRRKTREMMKLSPEEPSAGAVGSVAPRPPSGVIRFETGKLPSEFAGYNQKRESNRPGRVVIVIAALAVVFIAIIAWFIAQEPPK